MAQKTELGFIGLGQMGAPMAQRLLAHDVRLHVHDASPEAMARFAQAGAIAHSSPRAVADAATIVFACLPGQSVSEQVALGEDGVIHGDAMRIYVETSTIGRACIEQIASALAGRGVATVDGPISGGPPAAREGRLAMMASGSPEALAQVIPWLGRIGRKVYTLGNQPGQAQIMKLVNNLVMAANMVVASEGLVMGARAGLDPEAMVEVLKVSTGASVALSDIIAPTALPGMFDFGARLSIVEKDMNLGVAEAAALDVPVPVIATAGSIWREAAKAGLSDEDFSSVIKLVESRGGATVRRRS